MQKNLLIGVTDGSARCFVAQTGLSWHESAWEQYILGHYEVCGARDFWVMCQQPSTMDEFQRMCEEQSTTGYFLDGNQWCKYYNNGEAYVWEEIKGIKTED